MMQKVSRDGGQLPMSYVNSVCYLPLLRNDFKKFLDTYEWRPDEMKLKWAIDAYLFIYGKYMCGSTLSLCSAMSLREKGSSPGYPFNEKFKTVGDCLNDQEAKRSIIECVLGVVKTGKYRLTWRGKQYDHPYWKASPKDEMRPIDKVINDNPDKRKTRVFMAGDLVTSLIEIMVYGVQNENILNAKRDTWSKYGMTQYYGGWDDMCRYLESNPFFMGVKEYDCNDMKHYEASVKEQPQHIIYKIRDGYVYSEEYSSEELKNMQNFIRENVIYSYVIDPDGYLIMKLGGNPSGHMNTLTDNQMWNIIAHLYQLAKVSSTEEELIAKAEGHKLCLLGDDSVVPHHPDFSSLFTNFGALGLKVSPELPTCGILGIKFLNQGVIKVRDVYYPSFNYEKIRANILYVWKSRSWRLTFVKCCAYRIMSYFSNVHWAESNIWCQYILDNHDQDMKNETRMDLVVTYKATISQYLTIDHIRFLWTGNECSYVKRRIPDEFFLTHLLLY